LFCDLICYHQKIIKKTLNLVLYLEIILVLNKEYWKLILRNYFLSEVSKRLQSKRLYLMKGWPSTWKFLWYLQNYKKNVQKIQRKPT
jgi:hypothetical protein